MAVPSAMLERVNNVFHPDMPRKMFVTCLYAILEPATCRLQYANAGHNLPFIQRQNGVDEMRATGMPLGLLPGMSHEVEDDLALHLLTDLGAFTGRDWGQEDDVTLVTLKRLPFPSAEWCTLAQFETSSQPGNERQVMARVAEIVKPLGISTTRLERLKTAVAEAAMNAMEHGNHYDPEKSVKVKVLHAVGQITVRISDHSGSTVIPTETAPDIEAKLVGLQSPRGWGLFLIKSMVDKMHVFSEDQHHTLELIFNLEGDFHAGAPA